MTILGVSSITIGTKGSTDPGTLVWSLNTWTSNPIALSLSNAGSLASLTFNFNPTSSVTNGVFCVTLPQGFSAVSNCVSSVTISAGVDTSVTLPSVTLPSTSGVYAPFGIFTRASSSGIIFDMNLNFATVNIPAAVTPGTFAVSVDSNTILASTAAHFAFTLSTDLWYQDYFEISVPSAFTIKNPACSSESTSASYIKGPNALTPSSLPCYLTGSSLYIYGLSTDVVLASLGLTSLSVSLKVSGVTNPPVAYAASTMAWTLFARRYGSFQVLQSFSTTGPNIAPSALVVNSWTPHFAQTLVGGRFTYIDLSFTLAQPVPLSGSISFSFTGANINSISYKSDSSQTTSSSYAGYYYFTPSVAGSFTVTSSTLLCTGLTAAVSAGTYVFTSLPLLSGTAASVTITTADAAGNSIQLSAIFTTTFSTAASLLTGSSLKFALDSTGSFSAFSGTSVIGYYMLKCPVNIPANSLLTIGLPIVSGTGTEVALGTTSTFKANSLISTTALTGYSALLGSLAALSDPAVITNSITVSLPAVASGNYIYIYFTADAAALTPGLVLPTAGSNLLTYYEVRSSLTISSVEYVYSTPVTIIPRTFSASSVALLCNDYTIAGMPLAVSFTPAATFSTSLGTLYLALVLSTGYATDLGSGLAAGSLYPGSTSISSVYFVLGASEVIMIGLTGLSTSASSFAVPLGASTTSSPTGYLLAYFVESSSSVNYEVMKSSFTITGGSATNSYFTSSSVASTYVSSVAASPQILQNFNLAITPLVSSTYTTGYFGVFLPAGVNITTASVYLTTSTSTLATVLYSFNSPSNSFAFPSVFFDVSASVPISASTSSITISGLTAAEGASTSSLRFLLAPSANAACTNYAMLTEPSITTTALSFSATSFLPATVTALGPTSLLTNVTASLTMPTNIPSTGVIQLTISWSLSSLYTISVSGVSTFTSSVSGSIISISGFSSISSQTVVSITIYNVLPPSSTTSTTIFSSIHVFTDNTLSNTMVSYTGTATVQITGASSTGLSYFSKVEAIPNGVGLTAQVLNLAFTLTHSLPPTATLNINSATGAWLLTGDVSLYCWCSLQYSSCSIATTVLTITLAQGYTAGSTISIALDQLISLPSTSGATSKGFTITSSFAGVNVDVDSVTAPSALQALIVNALPNATLTLNSSIAVYPTTIGELATYQFVFNTSVVVSLSNTIIVTFSKNYDPFLGTAEELFPLGDPGSYYIGCASNTTGLQNIVCKVNHWMIGITGISTNIAIGTMLNITFAGIRNPAAQGTIGIYIVKSIGTIIAYNASLAVTPTTALGGQLVLRRLFYSTGQLRQSAAYTFEVYLTAAAVGSDVVIEFPAQFYLVRDNYQSVLCSAVAAASSWALNVTNCSISGNSVLLPVSTAFSGAGLVNLTVTLNNPEWGFPIAQGIYNGMAYSSWSNKIDVGVITAGQYLLKSYGQHGAYLGFSDAMKPVDVNGYSAVTGTGYINVKPGTQTTNLVVSVSRPLRAVGLVLTPRNSVVNQATLAFSSSKNFTITKDLLAIDLAVSTPSSAANSQNYIEWTIAETSLNGTALYSVVFKTLVIVYSTSAVSLSMRTNAASMTQNIYKNSTSLPIEIYTDYPPYSDLSLQFSMLNSSITGVIFTDTTITLLPGEKYKYFTIELNTTFNGYLSVGYDYFMSMSGSDVLAYSQIAEGVIMPINGTDSLAPTISSLSFSQAGTNSAVLSVSMNSMALVYWEFCEESAVFSTYEALVAMVYPLTSQNSTNYDLDSQITNYLLGLRETPYSYETWATFQKKMFAYAVQTCFYGSDLVGAGSTVLFSPTYLWASTTYKAQLFAQNTAGNYTSANASVTTSTMNSPLGITITFNPSYNSSLDIITSALAQSMGVVAQMLTVTGTTRRRNLLTSYSCALNADRSTATTPTAIYAGFDSGLFSSIIGQGFSISQVALSSSAYQVPVATYAVNSTTLNSVTMAATFTGEGLACCIAEDSPSANYTLASQQVYVGVDRNNNAVMHNCTDLVANFTLVINGLASTTTYTISCISASYYPVWPSFSAISNFTAYTNMTQNKFVASEAMALVLSLLLLNLA